MSEEILSETSRRTRNSLLVFSSISIIVAVSGVEISHVSFSGIVAKFDPIVVAGALLVFTAYFWFSFLRFASFDVERYFPEYQKIKLRLVLDHKFVDNSNWKEVDALVERARRELKEVSDGKLPSNTVYKLKYNRSDRGRSDRQNISDNTEDMRQKIEELESVIIDLKSDKHYRWRVVYLTFYIPLLIGCIGILLAIVSLACAMFPEACLFPTLEASA